MNKNTIKYIAIAAVTTMLWSCQDLDRPELMADYPKDINEPGGPLKFYTSFDGTTDNSLMNAVDSIKAKFPMDNPLATIDGVSGKAVQGQKYKYIKYSSANDFAQNAGSFTVSVWAKKGEIQTDHIFSMPSPASYHWSASSMFLLTEGGVSNPLVKFFVKDATGEKWFEWVGNNAVTGIYDGNWHHLVFVYDGGTSKMTMYVDGKAHNHINEWTGHGNVKLEAKQITSLKIGAGPQEFSAADIANNASDWLKNGWTGGIDQFRMYTTALTAIEVSQLYNNKK